MMDHGALTLVQANREQVIVSWKRHSSEWGRGLSEDQYLAREKRFERFEHASHGKMTVWILVPKNDPLTLDFFCSCETFRRKALRADPFSTGPEEVTAYGIASVFCPPEHRRKGYASHMMRLLHHVLASRSTFKFLTPPDFPAPPPGIGGEGLFSVLYSDVGEFYKNCGPEDNALGWGIRGAVSTRWPTTLPPSDLADPPATLLTLEQCQDLWEVDAQYIYDTFKGHSPTTRVAFLPTGGVAAFLAVRAASFFLENPPTHWGVALAHAPGDIPTYATWTLDGRVLVATRLRATPITLPALIRALAGAARTVNATEVEAWNLNPELEDAAARFGGKTVQRTDHLPAVAWYGSEELDEVEWLFNEK